MGPAVTTRWAMFTPWSLAPSLLESPHPWVSVALGTEKDVRGGTCCLPCFFFFFSFH